MRKQRHFMAALEKRNAPPIHPRSGRLRQQRTEPLAFGRVNGELQLSICFSGISLDGERILAEQRERVAELEQDGHDASLTADRFSAQGLATFVTLPAPRIPPADLAIHRPRRKPVRFARSPATAAPTQDCGPPFAAARSGDPQPS